ncbi:MAG: PQQ-binding-like beta-propeller repeat protein [Pirellulales bacterium]
MRWRTPIGAGYSGPTVADGRVYVTDRVAEPEQIERVHCFDWQTGTRVWSHTYQAVYEDVGYMDGPRAAVTIDDGRAYSLGTMGHLHCFDAATGAVLWKWDLRQEYQIRMPMWGLAAAPIVDQNLLIVQVGGSEGSCIVAFDKRSGAERWRALDDRASYAAPLIIERAGQRLFICWTGDHLVGMNPQTGLVYWKHPFPPTRMVLNVATPVVAGNRIFLTAFYDGAEMLRLADDGLRVDRIWRRQGASEQETEALHSIISTPLMFDDHVYGVDSYGELRCLDAATGERIWEDLTATPKGRWSTIHMVRNGPRVWMFNERGELIIGRLTPKGFHEISRAKLIDPTTGQLRRRGGVCWSHPAFAYRHVFARNDKELVCANLAADPSRETKPRRVER